MQTEEGKLERALTSPKESMSVVSELGHTPVEVPELPPTLNDEELTALKGLVESLDNTSSLEYSWRSQYIAARAFVSSCTE